MAFRDMYNELLGTVPGLNVALARTKINEALALIYDTQLWSFQCAESGWLSPGLFGGNGYRTGGAANYGVGLSPGRMSVQPFQNLVTGDAVASAAWLGAAGRPFLTEQQFRVPYYSLYNIIAVDGTNPLAVVLTLDRPWMEPAQTLSGYMIYQAYFAAPVGFKKFFTARDTTNNNPMDFWSRRQTDLAAIDPQRVFFDQPAWIVPYQQDMRPNSSTAGQLLYELWPHPLSSLPYSFSYLRQGPLLQAATDTVPYPLNEELVKWRALEVCFLWAEAQKGVDIDRGSGADWRFLSQEAHAQYEVRLGTAKRLDQNMVDLYFNKFRRGVAGHGEAFATQTGQLNVGGW